MYTLELFLVKLIFMLIFLNLNVLAQGQTQGSTLQQHTNNTLTIDAFSNTCKADEVSPDVESGGGIGIKCL
jgi:hypothetical protein